MEKEEAEARGEAAQKEDADGKNKKTGAEDEEEEGPTLPPDLPRHDVKKRLRHSILIILALMYLRVSTLVCENFLCVFQPKPVASLASNAIVIKSLLLDADGSTACYIGGHAATTVVAIVCMLFYIIGFPLACFVYLLRAFGSEATTGWSGWAWRRWEFLHGSNPKARAQFQGLLDQWHADEAAIGNAPVKHFDPTESLTARARTDKKDEIAMLERMLSRDRSDRFGFLYDGLLPEDVTFVVWMIVLQFLYAAVGVFIWADANLQLFLFNLITFLDCAHTGYAMPWEGLRENVKAVSRK